MLGHYWRADEPGVSWLITDRSGGVSSGHYQQANLGDHVGDVWADVAANRARLASDLGVSEPDLRWLRQVHGSQVARVVSAGDPQPPMADAHVTDQRGLALAVLVADCVPVLLADVAAGIVAAVHAGRPGLIAQVVPAAVHSMRELGAIDIDAVVGPSVCGRCYEVPAHLQEQAAAIVPASMAVSWSGTPAIDVAAGVVTQLRDAEVRSLRWIPGCTREDERLYSYRRDGKTGRFAAVVVAR